MKENYIVDLREGDNITDFYMVKSIALKIGANKKQYLDLTLGDMTGEISSKKWDVSDQEAPVFMEIKEGEIVKVKANVTEWNGIKQFRVTRIRKTTPEDNIEIAEYVKAAPEPAEEMYDFIHDVAENLKDEDLRKLCVKLLDREKGRLLYYPAATKNHHAQMAGLLWHVKRMLMNGQRICQVYTFLNESFVLAGVILHDMQKLNEIDSNELGIASEYTFEGNMLGHLVLGVRELEKEMIELDFSREKAIMVEHMILAHHYEPEFGSPKKPLFPEAEILHYLDIIDARMFDMEDALSKTTPGEFSDRVWTLDNRRLYKMTEEQ